MSKPRNQGGEAFTDVGSMYDWEGPPLSGEPMPGSEATKPPLMAEVKDFLEAQAGKAIEKAAEEIGQQSA